MKNIILIICFFYCYTVIVKGQTKWKNAMDVSFPVLKGRLFDSNDYSRLPYEIKDSVRTAVWDLSQQSAGLFLDFRTNSSDIIVEFTVSGPVQLPHMPATGVSGVDLYAKTQNGQWEWVRGNFSFKDTVRYQFYLDQKSNVIEEFRLFLPLYNKVENLKVGVSQEFDLEFRVAEKESPIIVYGTSIAQGACASRPGMAWSTILSRESGYQVVNLGFSGNGLLEKELIHFIGESKASLFILDCLPNLMKEKGLSDKDIRERIRYAVNYLYNQHSQTTILLTSHGGYSVGVLDPSRKKIYTHLNELLEEEYHLLLKGGKENLHLLGINEIGLTDMDFVDGTHPNDRGMVKYANAYQKKLQEIGLVPN
jgi:lysophospholipase L1-like esterase